MKGQEAFARREIFEAMKSLDPQAQARVVQRVVQGLPEIIDRHKRKWDKAPSDFCDMVAAWEKPPYTLSRNECSRIHKLREAIEHGNLALGTSARKVFEEEGGEIQFVDLLTNAHPFVVEHDWARAFEGADVTGEHADEIRLPFEECVFELRINGRVVVLAQIQDEPNSYAFVQGERDRWWGMSLIAPMYEFAMSQIRAICIALDAEVAAHEIIRGPAKLNAAREKKGAVPLNDYHVVRLTGRHTQRAPDMGGTHRSPRLHFRRGHWRHLETHTVWIRWHLVGNPDLGFIDKSYKL